MTTQHDVSRRTFLTGTAGAGAMAAAAATLGIGSVANAEDEGSASTDGAAGGEFSAQALPEIIRGAKVGMIGLGDFVAGGITAGALQFSPPGVYSAGGWIDAALQIPSGGRLLRIDSYARTAGTAAPIGFYLNRTIAGLNPVLIELFTASGLGSIQASYVPAIPYTVPVGEGLFLETVSCTSVNRLWANVIYQYYDANPQLNLLPVPIRVYDSRAGANPASVVKGQLSNGAQRVIDCTFSGAVPVGAAAAMVTLTTVGTVGAGFMALWKNGLAYPNTSSINWDHSGTNVAVTTVCALDATAKLLALTGPGASTDFIIDVLGFYA